MNFFGSSSRISLALSLTFAAMAATAQQPAGPPVRPPYGEEITLDLAKKIAAAAEAEAKKNYFKVAIAVVDNHGFLVFYEKLADTQNASATIAIEKARTSAMYRRASKEFEDNIVAGRVALLGLPGVTPIEGGLPIVVAGKMVGAIGDSGMTSSQDAQVGRAGLEAPGAK